MTELGTEEIRWALAAFVRERFQAPVVGLRALIDIMAEDAAAAGLAAYADDVGRMQAAGERLMALVTSALEDPGRSDDAAILRHDLRTPVTAVLGYGELIAEEARDAGDAAILTPLADVLEAASRLLREFDRLVAFNVAAPVELLGQAIPDELRQAVEAVRGLARPDAAPVRTVTGRILVVDDNDTMRDVVARRLTREGHEVETCGSGQEALERARRGGLDLMLLDLMMPGLNGLEVLARLRARAATRTMPVVVISALDQTDAAVRCIEAGADDFLSKPINETLLRARITAALERKFLRDREQEALGELRRERDRSESLLRNVLPESAVERLRAGANTVADQFDDVTVLFCDIVGFTPLSARLPPAETLDLLNGIFSGFDRLAEEHGLEKIKTIGDAYMVVGGMSEPVADHAARVVRMARGMPAIAAASGGLSVRIGIDRGPAVAGIIGRRKFFYDVWGDTVNFASRLEAAAEPGRIHVSAAVRAAVESEIACVPRPPMEIKGKGLVSTFYVADGASAAGGASVVDGAPVADGAPG